MKKIIIFLLLIVNTEAMVHCKPCNEYFISVKAKRDHCKTDEHRAHIKFNIPWNKRKFICYPCRKGCDNLDFYNWHCKGKLHQAKQAQPFDCHFCNCTVHGIDGKRLHDSSRGHYAKVALQKALIRNRLRSRLTNGKN